MPRRTNPVLAAPGHLPSRESNPLPARCDASRRRFLRQLAGGSGAMLLGFPRLSHGQSLAVDFSRLDRHRRLAGLGEDDQDRSAEPEEMALEAREEATEEAESLADADAEPLAPVEAESAMAAEVVEENRALWIEPGYLVLLRWMRPAADLAPVAALEASADAIGDLLRGRVESVDTLHNLDLLHPLERDIAALLAERVAPAEILVLHLDHDCTRVCSSLDPSHTYPEIIQVDGEMSAPGWE